LLKQAKDAAAARLDEAGLAQDFTGGQ